MKKLAVSLAVLALGAAGPAAALAAAPAPAGPNPAARDLVCHVTGSATNPVVDIYVPAAAKAPATPCDVPDDGGYGF